MIYRFLILLSAIACIPTYNVSCQAPEAVNGILDLRDYASDHFTVRLNGYWEFYWNRMLRPVDFKDKKTKPDFYGKVPSYWTDYKGLKTSKFGYATYRLKVILPEGYRRTLGFNMPVFDSSYDMFLDSEYLGGNGITGRSTAASKPGYQRNYFRYNPESDTLNLIINVSNFDHRRGGFWLPVEIGTASDVERHMLNSRASEWATVSLLLGFSIFFFFFFIMSPGDKLTAFFSLVTFSLALRPLFTSHFLILNLFETEWNWIIRFEYIGLYTGIIGGSWYSYYLYPTKLFRKIAYTFTFLFSICLLSVFLLPVRLFSYSVLLVYPSILLLVGYLLYSSLRGATRKSLLDLVYFIAFIFLIAGAINDMKISLGNTSSSGEYLLSYIIVIFLIIQAALLLYKWVRSYNDRVKLQKQLEYMNRNLEMLVGLRTKELKSQKEEIEEQNRVIAEQNLKLSDTLQIRNKMFSVISHDLRNPAVNILYMLLLLKEQKVKEEDVSYVNSCIESSQRIIDLLENMLAWGREQENRIKYSPVMLDLSEVVMKNLDLLRENTSKKKIKINFIKTGNPVAYFDRDLLDIIVRNLLSNATKYSHAEGRIDISLIGSNGGEKLIRLKIADQGVGISESRLKTLFNGGELISTPGTANEKGTGLGLKLCHDLIQLNKGDIKVDSLEGKGTCITITLPAEAK
jgi:signal transduction histidine kinase